MFESRSEEEAGERVGEEGHTAVVRHAVLVEVRRRRVTRRRELVARGRLLVLRRILPRRRRTGGRRVAPVSSTTSSSISTTAFIPPVPPSVPALVLAGISVHLASVESATDRGAGGEWNVCVWEKRGAWLSRGEVVVGIHLRESWDAGGARGNVVAALTRAAGFAGEELAGEYGCGCRVTGGSLGGAWCGGLCGSWTEAVLGLGADEAWTGGGGRRNEGHCQDLKWAGENASSFGKEHPADVRFRGRDGKAGRISQRP